MSPRPEPAQDAPVVLMQVVGARPQFVKLAPVCRAIEAANARAQQIESLVVHTGQHYDPAMSDVFFSELGHPEADLDLGIGSGIARATDRPHAGSAGDGDHRAPAGPGADLRRHQLDARRDARGRRSCTCRSPTSRPGLRSFNRRMPEEANRLVADHLSDLLFAPTPEAMRNLANEGLAARARLVGDVMLDAIRAFAPVALERSRVLERLGLAKGGYLVATLHRAENTDGLAPRRAARSARGGRHARAARGPAAASAHGPRHSRRGPRAAHGRRIADRGTLGYLDMISLVSHARIVLTDSGGLQKEAFFLGRPCVTLREETEWVETVTCGGNIIAGTDPRKIREAVAAWDATLARGEPGFRGRGAPILRRRRRVRKDRRASSRIPARARERLSGRLRRLPECAPGHA